jgi:hypothetical protein
VRRVSLVVAFAVILALVSAQAQGPILPGPGLPVAASGGGCGTGVIDATAGCPLPMLGL